jgi:aminopeptidase YwaD
VNSSSLSAEASSYLQRLCLDIPTRRVGSQGNQLATDYFAETVAGFGFQTDCPQFDCIDWEHGEVQLYLEGEPLEAFVSPYSLDCHATAPLAVASTLEDLETLQATGKIVLLHGEIAKEQLMPKNFTFYNPDLHKHIIRQLETKDPLAIIAATSRNPELAGGIYPFPLIEDGDFDIPSVYMTEEKGDKMVNHTGKEVSLHFEAKRSAAQGCNVIARKGADPHHRVVLFAHIDAKDGTPGALDNATGVVVLLLLAEKLSNYSGELGIEIVALNGEDYYSAAGEMQYLDLNSGIFQEILLGINLDGAGYHQGKTAYSLYDCPLEIASSIHKHFSPKKWFIEGEQWYQSDHSLFIMNQRPALAITSERFTYLSTHITHTAKDHPRLVDPSKLVAIAQALQGLLLDLDGAFS